MTLIQRRLNVDATSRRCIDVEPTLYKRHVPAGIALAETSIQITRYMYTFFLFLEENIIYVVGTY